MSGRFCKDCRHHEPNRGARLCTRPGIHPPDPVTGEARHRLCRWERADADPRQCGPGGRFFEHRDEEPPRFSVWARIFRGLKP